MFSFSSKIEIIGVNPYVLLPENILLSLFNQFGKDKGPIPIKGTINKKNFIQTLVKYKGLWRFYINTPMIKATNLAVGDTAQISLEIDKESRGIAINTDLKKALEKNIKAKNAFETYPPSRQKEINRYLNNIKTKEILEKNISRIVRHLAGEKVEYHVLLRNK